MISVGIGVGIRFSDVHSTLGSPTEVCMLLAEDGGRLLLEDGSGILLEKCEPSPITGYLILDSKTSGLLDVNKLK